MTVFEYYCGKDKKEEEVKKIEELCTEVATRICSRIVENLAMDGAKMADREIETVRKQLSFDVKNFLKTDIVMSSRLTNLWADELRDFALRVKKNNSEWLKETFGVSKTEDLTYLAFTSSKSSEVFPRTKK